MLDARPHDRRPRPPRGRDAPSTPATRSRSAASSRTRRPAPRPPRSAPTCAHRELITPPATVTVHQGVDMGRPSLLTIDDRRRPPRDPRQRSRGGDVSEQVVRLRVGQRVDLDAQRRELQRRDLALDRVRHRVHARRPRAASPAPRRPAPAARTRRPSPPPDAPRRRRGSRPARRPAGSAHRSPSSKRSTSGRISRTPDRRRAQVGSEISTSNCPALASTAPSFMRVEVLAAQHVRARP